MESTNSGCVLDTISAWSFFVNGTVGGDSVIKSCDSNSFRYIPRSPQFPTLFGLDFSTWTYYSMWVIAWMCSWEKLKMGKSHKAKSSTFELQFPPKLHSHPCDYLLNVMTYLH